MKDEIHEKSFFFFFTDGVGRKSRMDCVLFQTIMKGNILVASFLTRSPHDNLLC